MGKNKRGNMQPAADTADQLRPKASSLSQSDVPSKCPLARGLHLALDIAHRHACWLALAGSGVAIALGTVNWLRFLDFLNSADSGFGPTTTSFGHLMLPMVLLPIGIVLLLVSANLAATSRRLAPLCIGTAGAICGTILSIVYWAQPRAFFNGDTLDGDATKVYWGQIVAATGIIISATLLSSTVRMIRFRLSSNTNEASPLDSRSSTKRSSWMVVAFLVLYLPMCLFLSMLLPDHFWGKWSWRQGGALDTTCESERLWCIELSDGTKLQLWKDVALYYGFLYLVSICGLLSQWSPKLRQLLHTQLWITLPFSRTSKAVDPDKPIAALLDTNPQQSKKASGGRVSGGRVLVGPSVGTCALVVAFCVLVGVFTQIWYTHQYEGSNSTRSNAEVWARTLGQLSNLLLSLLSLPAARNSIWSTIFGVSWEDGIRVHVWLGYSLLAVSAGHMGLWWKVFDEQNNLPADGQNGRFPHDIFAVRTAYHSDNWTISPMVLIWFVMAIFFGLFAHNLVRRKWFELFYWSHHLAIVVFIGALMHASSLWYYLVGGLSLWILDRMIRFSSGCRAAEVVDATTWAGDRISELNIRVEGGFEHTAGQYCFINIPELSNLQWHPFTIASKKADGSFSLMIKSMGEGTFTGQLASLVAKGSPLTISVDGPYGIPVELAEHERAVFVAGGIGITPVHAIVEDICNRLTTAEGCHVIWVCQTTAEVEMISGWLRRILEAGVNVSIYVTRGSLDQQPQQWDDLDIQYMSSSKIDFGAEVAKHAPTQGSDKGVAFACGPERLKHSVQMAALEQGLTFHSETFEL